MKIELCFLNGERHFIELSEGNHEQQIIRYIRDQMNEHGKFHLLHDGTRSSSWKVNELSENDVVDVMVYYDIQMLGAPC